MYYLGRFVYGIRENYSPLIVNKFSVYYRYRYLIQSEEEV